MSKIEGLMSVLEADLRTYKPNLFRVLCQWSVKDCDFGTKFKKICLQHLFPKNDCVQHRGGPAQRQELRVRRRGGPGCAA